MAKSSAKKGKLLVGNWKMNLTAAEAARYIKKLKSSIASLGGNVVALCPSFTSIPAVAAAAKGSSVKIGAQNVYFEEKGAFTGEISPLMLAGLVEFVLVGHSERRHIFGERDDEIVRKVAAVLRHEMTPILCVGETLVERGSGHAERVVATQLERGLEDVSKSEISKVVVAYEPVWAIGTGVPIKPKDAEDMADFIRQTVDGKYGRRTSRELKVLYGGSVNKENVEDFITLADIDGALVGGASVYLDEWMEILKIAGVRVKR